MKAFLDVEKGSLYASSSLPKMNSRPVLGTILIILLICLTFSLYTLDNVRKAGDSFLDQYRNPFSKVSTTQTKAPKMASRLYPEELMKRTLATDLTSIPKIFHQSWVNETLPAKFHEWSESCRSAHLDWEWVLWTDYDNLKLVEKYAPWFLHTYDFLQSEIYRADTARNIYMHVFGGVYADLDTECLLPYDSLFEAYNVTTVRFEGRHSLHPSGGGAKQIENIQDPSLLPSDQSQVRAERKVFVAQMGVDIDEPQSIPNAWMASTPGHPFWLLPMEASRDLAQVKGMQPEVMTGPIALYDQVIRYSEQYGGGKGNRGVQLDQHYTKSGWRHLYKPSSDKTAARTPQSLVVLPPHEVYPYSWQRDGFIYEKFCSSSEQTFDAEKCKLLLGLEHWGSHSITYWSHSWSGEGNGHWDEHMDAISKETKKSTQTEEDTSKGANEKTDKGDAVEANKKAEEAKRRQE